MMALSRLLAMAWVILGFITAAVLTVWAAYLYGREISNPDQILIVGLALNGFVILGLGLTMTIGTFAGPLVMRRCWTGGQQVATTLIGLAWLAACAASAASVILINPLDLPMQGSGAGYVAAGSWALYVLLMGALPATVVGVFKEPFALRQLNAAEIVLPRSAQERLWNVLQDLAQRRAGPAALNVVISDTGCIVTSQGALAELAGISKGAVNRGLKDLQQEGRIEYQATKKETVIRILVPGELSSRSDDLER